jgi:hypothetical protein
MSKFMKMNDRVRGAKGGLLTANSLPEIETPDTEAIIRFNDAFKFKHPVEKKTDAKHVQAGV